MFDHLTVRNAYLFSTRRMILKWAEPPDGPLIISARFLTIMVRTADDHQITIIVALR